MNERTLIFISDGTAITIKAMGDSLATQFPHIQFKDKVFPYVDTVEKAVAVAQEIEGLSELAPPLLFSSLVNPDIRAIFKNWHYIDLFDVFLPRLSYLLETKPFLQAHKMHSIDNLTQYSHRIESIDYALQTDDGLGLKHYDMADLILIGPSRTGKTPTSLYLALNYGIMVANYPFTEEIFNEKLPKSLSKHVNKLFGLTISPKRLSSIRQARYSGSHYAELNQCQKEINDMMTIYQKYKIPYLDTASRSIEEIATHIISIKNL